MPRGNKLPFVVCALRSLVLEKRGFMSKQASAIMHEDRQLSVLTMEW